MVHFNIISFHRHKKSEVTLTEGVAGSLSHSEALFRLLLGVIMLDFGVVGAKDSFSSSLMVSKYQSKYFMNTSENA
jgi:hypothetical protein